MLPGRESALCGARVAHQTIVSSTLGTCCCRTLSRCLGRPPQVTSSQAPAADAAAAGTAVGPSCSSSPRTTAPDHPEMRQCAPPAPGRSRDLVTEQPLQLLDMARQVHWHPLRTAAASQGPAGHVRMQQVGHIAPLSTFGLCTASAEACKPAAFGDILDSVTMQSIPQPPALMAARQASCGGQGHLQGLQFAAGGRLPSGLTPGMPILGGCHQLRAMATAWQKGRAQAVSAAPPLCPPSPVFVHLPQPRFHTFTCWVRVQKNRHCAPQHTRGSICLAGLRGRPTLAGALWALGSNLQPCLQAADKWSTRWALCWAGVQPDPRTGFRPHPAPQDAHEQ